MASGRRKQAPRREDQEDQSRTRVTFTVDSELKAWLRMRATTMTIETGRVVTIGDLGGLALKRYRRAVERLEKGKENRDE